MALHTQSTHNGFKIVYDDTSKRYHIVSLLTNTVAKYFEFAADAIEYALDNGYGNDT